MTPFSQKAWACRCEWGPAAVSALAPADVTVVIDVFSFTTCVDVAASRGAAILPYPWNDASAAEFARRQTERKSRSRRLERFPYFLPVRSGTLELWRRQRISWEAASTSFRLASA